MTMSTSNGLVLVLFSIISLVVIAASASPASVSQLVVDNTSPQLIFSPTPCYEDTPTVCSIEWVLVQSSEAFNGSVTSTDGPLPDLLNISLPILPRVTLNFNGSGISFFSGPNSTANASFTLDDRPSVIIDTSRQHYQVALLEDGPHILVIEYEADMNNAVSGSGVLEVDYFIIVQDQVVNTSSPTTSATSKPTTSAATSPPSSRLSTLTTQPTIGSSNSSSLNIEGSRDRPSLGTIIAIAISASALFLFALLAWTLSARHRRKRRAIKRENDILSRMKMPSEADNVGEIWSGGIHISKGKGRQTSRSWWP